MWLGHEERMNCDLPVARLYRSTGEARRLGRPRLRWMDDVEDRKTGAEGEWRRMVEKIQVLFFWTLAPL